MGIIYSGLVLSFFFLFPSGLGEITCVVSQLRVRRRHLEDDQCIFPWSKQDLVRYVNSVSTFIYLRTFLDAEKFSIVTFHL